MISATQRIPAVARWLGMAAVLGAIAAPPPGIEFARGPGSGQPNLTVTPDGAAVLTWLEPVQDRRYALRFAVRDAGRWSEPGTIASSDSFFVNWADFPSLVALGDGSWIAHWLARVPGNRYAYHVQLAISRDRGATWSAPITPHRDRSAQEHGFVSLVPLDDSTAALVWLDGRAMKLADGAHEAEGDMTLRFTTVTSHGRVGAEALLDARTCECCQTALARTAGGLVAAYRDRSDGEIRDIAVTRFVRGAWTAPTIVARDGWHYPGCPVNGPALSARGDTTALAWFAAPDGAARVQVAFSADAGASWSAPIRVDEGRPLGRVDVELLPDGGALVTWLEVTDAGTVVHARGVRRDGGRTAARVVAATSEARSSGFPRIVQAGSDLLVAWTGPDGVRVGPMPNGADWRPPR